MVTGRVGKVFAAWRGIVGVLEEALIDTAGLDEAALVRLARTPGGAFGSCRFDLPHDDGGAAMDRLFAVFDAHDIGWLRDLSISLKKLGDLEAETGNLAAAEAARLESQELLAQLERVSNEPPP